MRMATEARMVSASQRVRLGAAWLDAKQPGWHELISVGRLDVDSSTNCVIAQLNGNNFYVGLSRMDPLLNIRSHGFSGSSPADSAALNHEWRTLILQRQYGVRAPGLLARLRRYFTGRP